MIKSRNWATRDELIRSTLPNYQYSVLRTEHRVPVRTVMRRPATGPFCGIFGGSRPFHSLYPKPGFSLNQYVPDTISKLEYGVEVTSIMGSIALCASAFSSQNLACDIFIITSNACLRTTEITTLRPSSASTRHNMVVSVLDDGQEKVIGDAIRLSLSLSNTLAMQSSGQGYNR